MTRSVLLIVLLFPVSGCSVASLAWDDAIDKRMTQMDARITALQTQVNQQQAALAASR